jgi:hypothetical protein
VPSLYLIVEDLHQWFSPKQTASIGQNVKVEQKVKG